jgi:hypothetical protein
MSDEKQQRYAGLLHAMQSGVKMMQELDGSECTPKHLRVGVNSAMSDHGALTALLIRKGLFTEDEYADVLIEYMQREVASYERMISERLGGRQVTLA